MALVGAGGVLGALARHLVGERIEHGTRDTLAVNVAGSLLLGALVTAPVSDAVLLAFGTGFCGAFTTLSTFAFETVRLAEEGDTNAAVGNAAANLAGALAAVAVGFALGGAL